MQYTYVGVQAFQETGADFLNARVDEINANSLRNSLGGRIRYDWKLSDRISLVPEIQMLWQHEFINYAQSTSAWLETAQVRSSTSPARVPRETTSSPEPG